MRKQWSVPYIAASLLVAATASLHWTLQAGHATVLAAAGPSVVLDLGGCSGFLASHNGAVFIVTAAHCLYSVGGAIWEGDTTHQYDLKDEWKVAAVGRDVGFISLRMSEDGKKLAKKPSLVLSLTTPSAVPPIVVRGYEAFNSLVEAEFKPAPKKCGEMNECPACTPPAADWDDYAQYECLTRVSGGCLAPGNSGSVAMYEAGGWKLYGEIPARSCTNAAVVRLDVKTYWKSIECVMTDNNPKCGRDQILVPLLAKPALRR